MNNLQKQTAQMVEKYGLLADNLMLRYADLVSEVGELGKELVMCVDYGRKDFEASPNLAMELGDIMFCLAMIANSLDLDLEECFGKTMEKCRKRFEKQGHIGS